MTDSWRIITGDCLAVMREMGPESVDSVVCDPPYSLSFMGKGWDRHDSPQHFQSWCESWAREALRVAKPGAWLLAFGGTRTAHRLTCGIEDAGWEIRDSIGLLGPLLWCYGSGFPKSLDVSKAIDRAAGAERETVRVPATEVRNPKATGGGRDGTPGATRPWIEAAMARGYHEKAGDVPVTDAARQWEGWGTALKPAFEPIVVARKPLAGAVAENVQRYSTGALNIAGCRIGTRGRDQTQGAEERDGSTRAYGAERRAGGKVYPASLGRWPPNLALIHAPECRRIGTKRVKGTGPLKNAGRGGTIGALSGGRVGADFAGYADADGLEEVEAWECAEGCPVRMLDEQSGERPGGGHIVQARPGRNKVFGKIDTVPRAAMGDTGGASRYFLTVDGRDSITYDGACETTLGDTSASRTGAGIESGASPEAARSTPSLRRAGSGSNGEGRSQQGTKSTTGTTTRQTTSLPIFDSSRPSGTTTTTSGSVRTTGESVASSAGAASDAAGTARSDASPPEPPERSRATAPSAPGPTFGSGVPETETSARRTCVPIEQPGAVRFRYTAKADGSERQGAARARGKHPTVKPLDLMRWLVRLVTPPGGLVLDPFAGSGTTIHAALLEGFLCLGIEQDAEMAAWSRERIAGPLFVSVRAGVAR